MLYKKRMAKCIECGKIEEVYVLSNRRYIHVCSDCVGENKFYDGVEDDE